ncbi:MAG: TetR/AcrR family transcriptional regulator [Erysipelotrichales bacterium]|nr:TetR/AcrR family transcriptional regulator [Erysipelotrichales bacterium]
MSHLKEDRRVIKTKHSIKEAFITLLETQPIESITVQSITSKAMINRSTFYSHYPDVYALQQEIEDTFIQDIEILIAPPIPSLEEKPKIEETPIYKIFQYMNENRRITFLLFKEASNSGFILRLAQRLRNTAIMNIPANEKEQLPALFQNYTSSFLVYGIVGIMHRWVLEGGTTTPEEITHISLMLAKEHQ